MTRDNLSDLNMAVLTLVLSEKTITSVDQVDDSFFEGLTTDKNLMKQVREFIDGYFKDPKEFLYKYQQSLKPVEKE